MTQQDPIIAANERFGHDFEARHGFLFDVRCGGEPELLYDPVTGWELYMKGHNTFYSLEGSEDAVNIILRALAYHYRRLSAALGDPEQPAAREAIKRLRLDGTNAA